MKRNLRFIALGCLAMLPVTGIAISIILFSTQKDNKVSTNNTNLSSTGILEQLDKANQDNEELRNELSKTEKEIEDKEIQLNKLEKESQTLSEDKDILSSQLKESIEKEKNLQEKINSVEIELNKNKQKIEDLEKEIEDITNKDELANKYNNLLKEKSYLEKKVKENNEQIDKYKKEIDEAKNQILQYEKQIEQKDNDLKSKDNEINNIKSEISKIKDMYDNLLISYTRDGIKSVIKTDYTDYTNNLNKIGIYNKTKREIQDEFEFKSGSLLTQIKDVFNIKELQDISDIKNNLTIDLNTIKISKWEANKYGEIVLSKDLDNLDILYKDNYTTNNSINFDVIWEEDNKLNKFNYTLAFFVEQNEDSSKKWWNDFKENTFNSENSLILQNNSVYNLEIPADRYDSIMELINKDNTNELIKNLSAEQKISIPPYAILNHRIMNQTEEVKKINKDSNLIKDKHSLVLEYSSVNPETKELIYKDKIEINIILKDSYKDVLFNRIDNLNKQLLGSDVEKLNSIKQEIEELTIKKENIKENDKIDYANKEEYKQVTKDLETKENEKKKILYKNRLLVSSQAFKTLKKALSSTNKEDDISYLKYILSNVNSQEIKNIVESTKDEFYKERYNAYKGLINSDPSKNFNFNLIDNSVIEKINSPIEIEDKIYYKIEYSTTNENTGFSIVEANNPNTYYGKDLESIIKITFTYKEQYKEVEFAITNPSINEDIHQGQYEILSDALRNTDKQKVSYDIENNILTVKTSAEKFTKFIEASNKHLESTTNSETSRILVNALNDALGHKPTFDNSNGIKYMDKYWRNFELYGHYWYETVKNKINDINNKMQEEDYKVENYTYSTLFAGAWGADSIRFAFYIQWVIE